MKKIKFSASIILCLSMGIFFMNCDPALEAEEEALIIRMYNPEIAQAELLYLTKLDPTTLSPEELLEKATREADIAKLINNMNQSTFPYGGILETARITIPPGPTPCPDVFGCLGTNIPIQYTEIGIYQEPDSLTETDAVRKHVTSEPSVTIQIDSQHVFAVGTLKTPAAPPFKTARFMFIVVDKKLSSKDMNMVITTFILKEGKQYPVELTVPVPAHTFSAD